MPASALQYAAIAATTAAAAAVFVYARRRRRARPTKAATWEKMECRMPKKLQAHEREALRQQISLSNRSTYFDLSVRPITSAVEQRVVVVSPPRPARGYAQGVGATNHEAAS